MANLAAVDSDLHASHLRLDALHASMLFKLDFLSRKLDIMIFRQRSPSPSPVQPPPPPLPPFPPSAQPPSTPPAPPPCSHVPPPMARQRDSPVIGIDSSTIDFPVSVWQHHRADINRHFQSIQLWPLPLRTNTRCYRKIPHDNDINLHGNVVVAYQLHPRWIWVLCASET